MNMSEFLQKNSYTDITLRNGKTASVVNADEVVMPVDVYVHCIMNLSSAVNTPILDMSPGDGNSLVAALNCGHPSIVAVGTENKEEVAAAVGEALTAEGFVQLNKLDNNWLPVVIKKSKIGAVS
jgi:hypothetical protein